jgi:hypothetical protein
MSDIKTSPLIKSWRVVLPVHPAANLFPPMSAPELCRLGQDIKTNGLLDSVVIYDGQLLDGRNRFTAMEQAEIDFEVRRSSSRFKDRFELVADGLPSNAGNTEYERGDIDPWAYVISANLHRRHLTAKQKRNVIANLLKAQPEKSNRQIGEMAKADHKTVGAVRAEGEATGELPQLGGDRRPGRQGAQVSCCISQGARSRRRGDYLLILQKPPILAKATWKDYGIPSRWPEKIDRKLHPHIKPIGLISRLIGAVTEPGDLVVDPAAGSFVVMRAAHQLGREFVGCDLALSGAAPRAVADDA